MGHVHTGDNGLKLPRRRMPAWVASGSRCRAPAWSLLIFTGLALMASAPQLQAGAAESALIIRLRAGEPDARGQPEAVAARRLARITDLLADLSPRSEPAFPGARTAVSARAGPGRSGDPADLAACAADLAAVVVLRFDDEQAREAAAARLARDPDVVYAEPLFEFAVERADPAALPAASPMLGSGPVVPGDSLYAEQWSLPLIGMPAVWAGGTGTPGVIVGIVDTGIETAHPDLAPNLAWNPAELAGSSGVDDDSNGMVDDVLGWNVLAENADVEDGFGHGSHVAGIIGAASDGRVGTVGVTWDVGLLPVRMFDDNGRGTNLAGARGIVYAADRGAQIINLSWGTSRLSPVIRDAVAYAAASGAVLVASAGNAGGSVTANFPAAFDEVIAVGATTANDALAGFSNRGVRVDLVAPGVDIVSSQRGGHAELSGTSQAAALVSGVLAHLRYRYPERGAEELRSVLRLAAVDLGRTGWDPAFGAGRVDAAGALAAPSAPVAAIEEPRTLDALAGPSLAVRADVLPGTGVGGVADFALDVGAGEDPFVFTQVASGSGGLAHELGTIDLAARPEGEITIRLRVRDASGREAEDRVLVRIDRSAPALVGREHVDRLAGRRLEQLIRYEADEIVTGRVLMREVGSAGDFVRIESLEGGLDHVAQLSDFYPGHYEYAIDVIDLAGFTTRIDAGGGSLFRRDVMPLIDVPAEGYELVARLQGFDLGTVADLDADGGPELLGERRGFGVDPPHRCVLAAGEGWPGAPLFTSLAEGAPGLPVAARDVDGDGRPEVLVADTGLEVVRDLLAPGGGRCCGRARLATGWPAGRLPMWMATRRLRSSSPARKARA